MGAFEKYFNIYAAGRTDALDRSSLDLVTELYPEAAGLVRDIRQDLDRRNIELETKNGPMGGLLSFIFRCRNCPSAVVRIGQHDNPAGSVLVLKPAARLRYGTGDQQYQVHVLPYAPDEGAVQLADIINSVRVLKREGLAKNLLDVTREPFVFLRGADGDLLRYPQDTEDAAMRGRPIAFIRDLNALPDISVLEQMSCMGTVDEYFNALGIDMDSLPPAPNDCVAACRQQDVLAANVCQRLDAMGVHMAA